MLNFKQSENSHGAGKTILENVRIVILGAILSLGFGIAYAWTGPTGAPPTNNVSGILNTSAASQIKTGGLAANGFVSDGGLVIKGKAAIGSATAAVEALEVTGNAKAIAFLYSSDARLKKNVQPLGSELEKVLLLEPVSFDWKLDGSSDVGFIAQEVEKIFPEVVHTNSITNMKSIDYPKLTVFLVKALQEQQKEIELLKANK